MEGFCYRVENFEVQENWGRLRATHHGFRIFFKASTEVVRTNNSIPVNGFQCIPFLEILHRRVPMTYLIGMCYKYIYVFIFLYSPMNSLSITPFLTV